MVLHRIRRFSIEGGASMADSPENKVDQTGDNQDAVKPETKPETQPDETATDGTPKKSDQEVASEETTKLDASKISLEELLEREDIKRALQSVSDRARASERKMLEAEQKKREFEAKEQSEVEEERRLRETEDYETLGRRTATKAEAEERLMESLRAAGDIIGTATIERYIRELGEETVAKIQRDVRDRGGNLVDLQDELAMERQRRAVSTATKDAAEKIKSEVKEDIEALRAELGVKERSEAATKGETAVGEVSGGKSKPQTEEEDTYEAMSIKYGHGDITREEFLPYLEAHEKERGKKIR